MKVQKYYVLIFLKICFTFCHSTNFIPIVTTSLGMIKGNVLVSHHGNTFLAFRGIRYGRAPIGELRFQAPQRVSAWTDVFDATDDGPICPQVFNDRTKVSEDCLRLNVYTNNISSNLTISKKPVILFIPGGGLFSQSGVSTHYAGPQYLMDNDIVLVTINYRLGSLGFLSLGTDYCPGNAGFKDQVLAMKWVQDNIEPFGGDPNLVTIMGNSAGGFSVALHLVSPMSQGLFHRVIAMSGSIIPQLQYKNNQIDLAKRQAKILKCPEEPLKTMFDCLKSANSEEMSEKLMSMFMSGDDMPNNPWRPVLESDFGQERFLCENPTESLKNGNFALVPIMIGITKDELIIPAFDFVLNETKLNNLDKNFDELIPITIGFDRGSEKSIQLTNKIRAFYNLTSPLTLEHLDELNYLISDSVIGFGTHRLIQILKNKASIYYYNFSYKGKFSNFYYPDNHPYGVHHSDDLLYLFIRMHVPKYMNTDPESRMIGILTLLWTNFALNGNPNNYSNDIIGEIDWKSVDQEHDYYLDIGNKLVLKEGLNNHRYSIWDQLYPI